jgi:hypothetical protein
VGAAESTPFDLIDHLLSRYVRRPAATIMGM